VADKWFQERCAIYWNRFRETESNLIPLRLIFVTSIGFDSQNSPLLVLLNLRGWILKILWSIKNSEIKIYVRRSPAARSGTARTATCQIYNHRLHN
jgi:hypothetical protein